MDPAARMVLGVGDVNGDGFDDLAVIDQPTNPVDPTVPAERSARVYLFFGAASGIATIPDWQRDADAEVDGLTQGCVSLWLGRSRGIGNAPDWTDAPAGQIGARLDELRLRLPHERPKRERVVAGVVSPFAARHTTPTHSPGRLRASCLYKSARSPSSWGRSG